MGWEPIVYCRRCNEPLDVYQDYAHRWCDCTNPHTHHRVPVAPLDKRAFTTLEKAGDARRNAAYYISKGNREIAEIYIRTAYSMLFYARKARETASL